MYKYLKMFIHAEGIFGGVEVKDDELIGIIRLGSDTDDNYYQVEIPLKITNFNAVSPEEIWPVENNINAAIEDFGNLKLERIESGAPINQLYPQPQTGEAPEFRIRVKGNPNLSNIRTIMLGVKNNTLTNKSMELWYNELRVSDFDNKSSWAALINADANLADFADLSVTGGIHTIGFGSLDQMVNERSQDEMKQYGLVSNINIGQLLPKRASMSIPINFSFGEEFRDPKYDPQFQDVLFKNGTTNSDAARDYTQRKSLNFINVRKNRTSQNRKPQFYDVENLSLSYLYNETYHRDYNIQKFIDQKVRASANYTYSFQPKVIEPFKNWGPVSEKAYLQFIKDFNLNLLPTSFAVNSNIIRSYNEQLSRTLVEGLPDLPVLKQRNYMFDWDYLLAYNLTQSLQFSLRALNNYVFDEFGLDEDILIYDQFFRIGRPEHYHQTFNATYKIPFQKFPVLNFLNGTYNYTADYDWQAPAFTNIDLLGNTIQNANTHNFTAEMTMDRLYDYIGLSDLFTKRKTVGVKQDPQTGETLKAKKGRSTGQGIGRVFVDILTSVKNIRLSYTENNGTFLPGYIPEFGFLGQGSYSGKLAPTFGFVFGSQASILDKAIRNGWLLSRDASESYYARNYSKSHFDKFDYSANVRLTRDLDIELFGNRTFTESFNQQLDVVNGVLEETPKNGVGNFSISQVMIGAAFKDPEGLFDQFKRNRATISQRLADKTGGNIDGFGSTSQDVVLPAFLAAYTGKSAESIHLSAFKSTPVPNWRISYKGLMRIPWIKENFRSFTLEHSYRSVYSILSFTNNLRYVEDNPYDDINRDIAGNFNPQKLFNGVNLIEEFSPLVRVDFNLKNSFSVRAAFNKDKALNLNFNNNTVTEIWGEEIVLGMGYRIQNVKMKFKTGSGGGSTTFQGDINLKFDLGIREDLTVVRAYGIDNEIENDQITGGQSLLSFKFLADYSLNKNLLTSFYFDYNNSKFAISTTYPRTSINGGISVRYIIGN